MIHLTKIILQIWTINEKYVIDLSICKVELKCCFFPVGSTDCINSSSYEYRYISLNKDTIRAIGIATIFWQNTFPQRQQECYRLEIQASWLGFLCKIGFSMT